MNILYLSTVFPTERQGATIYTDLAEALHEAGHQMTVAAAGNTPDGVTRIGTERNLSVLRVQTAPYYNVDFIRKGVATYLLPRQMIRGIRKYIGKQAFDLILFESPPVTLSKTAAWAMKYFKCPSFLMLKDIFPQNGADLGLYRPNGVLYRIFRSQEKKLYKCASYIGCMSEANRQYLLKHNPQLPSDKLSIFPNTKKLRPLAPRSEEFPLRQKYGIPDDAVVFLFGGNLGKPQALDFLTETMISLKEEKKIFFVLVGRGSEKNSAKMRLERGGCKNYVMLENLHREEYEAFVRECDVGLILLDCRFTIPNYPSRILSYMEFGMPVLAATDRVTDIGDMIRQSGCGAAVYSEDAATFAAQIKRMACDGKLRRKMGLAGRIYAEKHFDVAVSVEKITEFLEENRKSSQIE